MEAAFPFRWCIMLFSVCQCHCVLEPLLISFKRRAWVYFFFSIPNFVKEKGILRSFEGLIFFLLKSVSRFVDLFLVLHPSLQRASLPLYFSVQKMTPR